MWRFLRTRAVTPSASTTKRSDHKKSLVNLLNEFHKAQCFFSTTLMIASFTQNIYDTNMLITFMLVPLATNGIVPVVLTYLFLVHYQKTHLGTTLYTLLTYTLSSIVYWSLYAHVSSLSPASQKTAYQQFMFKLSAIPACGGYSALAVCPLYAPIGLHEVMSSLRRIRVLTPIIWTFSTIVLLALLAYQLYEYRYFPQSGEGKEGNTKAENGEQVPALGGQRSRAWRFLFIIMTTIMLACLGMQLSTLAIGNSLNMMDPYSWSFGQIIAITVWAPPILEYLHGEFGRLNHSRLWSFSCLHSNL